MKRIAGSIAASALLLPAILFFAGLCHGFSVTKTSSGAEIRWETPSETIFVNVTNGPTGSLEAVLAAMQTWTDVATSNFAFVYGGITTKTVSDYGLNDGTNIIVFGPMGQNNTLAENTFWYYPSTGRLIDSDIKINTSYPYATDGNPSSYDVQSLTTHELGHSLSLGDLYNSADRDKTMYGYGFKGDISKRTLHQDDMDGITYLYPQATSAPPSVQTGAASSVTSSSAALGGSVNPNGLSTTYYFEYGTSPAYGSSTSASSAGSGSAFISVSKSVSALQQGTLYHFRLVAYNSAGITYGEDSTFLTPAPPSVQTGAASSVTSSSAALGGSVNPNGLSTTYYFEYGTSPAYGSSTSASSAGSGSAFISVSKSVSALQQGTLYHFRLVAYNAAGTTYGEDRVFETPIPPEAKTTPATAVKTSSLSGITSVSAQLNAVVNPYGLSTTYYFEYGTTDSYGYSTPATQIAGGSSEVQVSAKITGLTPDQSYIFRVVAINAAGTSYGNPMTFSTPRPNRLPWLRLLLLDEEAVGVRPSQAKPADQLPR